MELEDIKPEDIIEQQQVSVMELWMVMELLDILQTGAYITEGGKVFNMISDARASILAAIKAMAAVKAV